MNFSNISNMSGLNSGASVLRIAVAESQIGVVFNDEYKEFINYSNGGLFDDGISIYSMEDLPERNETYEIKQHCLGYLLIGDDSGGRGFLIDLRKGESHIFGSGLGDLDPADFVVVAKNLQDWIDKKFAV